MARQYDGLAVDSNEARFTGAFDLYDDNADKCTLDRVVVFMVMGRIDSKTPKVMDSGDLKLKHVIKVSDACLIEGDLREDALTFIAHGGQGRLDMGVYQQRNESEPPTIHVGGPAVIVGDGRLKAAKALEEILADENGERIDVMNGAGELVESVYVDDDDLPEDGWIPADEDDHVVIALDDYKQGAVPASSGGSGPKVAKFRTEDTGPVTETGTVIQLGSVYSDKHTGKDKVLARALETQWDDK